MIVRSSAFDDCGRIPKRHTGFGQDISPELIIKDAPEETVTLAIIMDDLDVPWTKAFNHWIAWNIPKTEVIPEGLAIDACQGIAWGKNCYRGPKQPFFIRGEHRYVFHVYALDCRLDITENARRKTLLAAMEGHVLAETEVMGRYEKRT